MDNLDDTCSDSSIENVDVQDTVRRITDYLSSNSGTENENGKPREPGAVKNASAKHVSSVSSSHSTAPSTPVEIPRPVLTPNNIQSPNQVLPTEVNESSNQVVQTDESEQPARVLSADSTDSTNHDEPLMAQSSNPGPIKIQFSSAPFSPIPPFRDIAMEPKPKKLKTTLCVPSTEDRVICGICLSKLANKHTTSTQCGHVFCTHCILRVFEKRNRCPICNQKLGKNDIHRIYL